MTRRPQNSDQDLHDRIRRSMSHYRMDRSLGSARRSRGPSWLRFALPVTAVLAGLAVSLTAIEILQMVGGPALPGGREALEVCQPHQRLAHIPDAWLEPGENRAAIRKRLENLPLVAKEEVRDLAIYLFSDGRLGSACLTLGGGLLTLGPFPHDVRTMHVNVAGESVRYEGGTSSLEGPVTAAGVAGQGVKRVEVIRADGARIDATLAGGVWLAWWPERVSGAAVEAFDVAGRLLGRHDAGIGVPAPAPPISEEAARVGCLQDIEVPEEWRLPGEDFDAAQARVRSLPLLIVDLGTHRSMYLLGDELHWALCTYDRLTEALGSTHGPRPTESEAVTVRAGRSRDPWTLPEPVLAGTRAPDVARVVVELADGSQVEARVEGGYWLASWRLHVDAGTVRAYDAEGNVVGEIPVPGGG